MLHLILIFIFDRITAELLSNLTQQYNCKNLKIILQNLLIFNMHFLPLVFYCVFLLIRNLQIIYYIGHQIIPTFYSTFLILILHLKLLINFYFHLQIIFFLFYMTFQSFYKNIMNIKHEFIYILFV